VHHAPTAGWSAVKVLQEDVIVVVLCVLIVPAKLRDDVHLTLIVRIRVVHWVREDEVAKALGSVSGSTGGEASPGVHGLGLVGTSIGGAELVAETPNSVVTEGTPEVEVSVQNQGESTENGVTIVVIANGKETTQEIAALEAGAEETAVVPLTPAPEGETTLEVEVEPVPGEQFTDNNEATYTVNFE